MTKDRLLVVGAGDFGREVLGWIRDIPSASRTWEFAGFLDDTVRTPGGSAASVPVVGTITDHRPAANEVLVVALGTPVTKLKVHESLAARGARFTNVIHPTAVIAQSAEYGPGLIACPGALISNDAKVGHSVSLNAYASVGHDAVVADGVTVSSYCDITGRVTLGRGAFLGSRATILPGLKVGEFSTIGAGSVVVRHVPANVTVFGIPAKRISGHDQN